MALVNLGAHYVALEKIKLKSDKDASRLRLVLFLKRFFSFLVPRAKRAKATSPMAQSDISHGHSSAVVQGQ
jgi:hypothetical protein